MNLLPTLVTLLVALSPVGPGDSGGVTPEQIFQQQIDWNSLVGSWEILPPDNPLAEAGQEGKKVTENTLMALRKDGTCRMFDRDHPLGADGLWTLENHDLVLTFPKGGPLHFYVYGVKGDFMITRILGRNSGYQLWSRVK